MYAVPRSDPDVLQQIQGNVTGVSEPFAAAVGATPFVPKPPASAGQMLDQTQAMLGAAGMLPGVGIIPDAISTVISVFRGNWVDVGINAVAMVPLLGQWARGGQYVAKGAGAIDAINDGRRAIDTAYDSRNIISRLDAPSRIVEQPRDALGRFLPKKGGDVVPGSIAEQQTWNAIKQKPGWQVMEGRVSARDATGQLRVYDGAAISPSGRVIGLEVKSGAASRTAAQRTFDTRLNANRGNTVSGVGENAGLIINRAKQIRK